MIALTTAMAIAERYILCPATHGLIWAVRRPEIPPSKDQLNGRDCESDLVRIRG
jgi:hypothetical protein